MDQFLRVFGKLTDARDRRAFMTFQGLGALLVAYGVSAASEGGDLTWMYVVVAALVGHGSTQVGRTWYLQGVRPLSVAGAGGCALYLLGMLVSADALGALECLVAGGACGAAFWSAGRLIPALELVGEAVPTAALKLPTIRDSRCPALLMPRAPGGRRGGASSGPVASPDARPSRQSRPFGKGLRESATHSSPALAAGSRR